MYSYRARFVVRTSVIREKAKALTTEMLHDYQEQAFRPVPQRVNFIVGWAGEPAPKRFIENGARCQLLLTSCTILRNRQDACSTKSEFSCGVGRRARTGKMPVPQEMNFVVEQASCLFIKGRSRMVQDVSYYKLF